MIIKNFNDFISEAISGTELIGSIGPGYGETRLKNKTIDTFDTSVVYSGIDDRIYTIDEYQYLYGEYLKNNGTPLDGYSKENLETVLLFLSDIE